MPIQIRRLLMLFAVIVGLFLLARHLLVPDSFGKYGHYRANAIDENLAFKAKHLGDDACKECHEEQVVMRDSSEHKIIACEACHGPGYKHVENPDTTNVIKPHGREFCGTCHAKNAARSIENVKQIDIKQHNTESVCTECHNPHEPWQMLK